MKLKQVKRLLAGTLSAVMILTSVPVNALAEEAQELTQEAVEAAAEAEEDSADAQEAAAEVAAPQAGEEEVSLYTEEDSSEVTVDSLDEFDEIEELIEDEEVVEEEVVEADEELVEEEEQDADLLFDDEEENADDHELHFNYGDYKAIRYDDPDHPYVVAYRNQTAQLNLSADAESLPEGMTPDQGKWTVGYCDENGWAEVFVEDESGNPDGSYTVNFSKYKEYDHIDVEVRYYVNKEEGDYYWAHQYIEIRDTEYNYYNDLEDPQFPQFVFEQEAWLWTEFDSYADDYDHFDGINYTSELVIDVEKIKQNPAVQGEDVISVELVAEEDGSYYKVIGLSEGSAEIPYTITSVDPDAEDGVLHRTATITVSGNAFYFDYISDDGADQIVFGGKKEIALNLQRRVPQVDGENEWSEVAFSVAPEFNPEVIESVTVKNNGTTSPVLEVVAKDQGDYTWINLTLSAEVEEKDGSKWTWTGDRSFGLNVTSDYYYMVPNDSVYLEVGERFSFKDYKLFCKGEKGDEEVKDAELSINYYYEAFELVDEDTLTFKRTHEWRDSIGIHADFINIWGDHDERNFDIWFDGMDYDTYVPGDHTVYADGVRAFKLEGEVLDRLEASAYRFDDWVIGYPQEDGVIEPVDPSVLNTSKIKDRILQIDGVKLSKIAETNENGDFAVSGKLYVNDTPVDAELRFDLSVDAPRYEVGNDRRAESDEEGKLIYEDWVGLWPGDSDVVLSKSFPILLYNAAYPEGKVFTLTADQYSFDNAELGAWSDDGEGWKFTARKDYELANWYGETTVTYKDKDGMVPDLTYILHMDLMADYPEVVFTAPDEISSLPGTETDYPFVVNYYRYDEAQKKVIQDNDQIWQWDYEIHVFDEWHEDKEYTEDDSIQITKSANSFSFTPSAKLFEDAPEEGYGFRIEVRFYCLREDGSRVVDEEGNDWVWERRMFWNDVNQVINELTLTPSEVYVAPGDVLSADSFEKKLVSRSAADSHSIRVSSYGFEPNAYFVLTENEHNASLSDFALTQLKDDKTLECELWLGADGMYRGEGGHWAHAPITVVIHNHDKTVMTKGKAATCTEAGLTDLIKCSICGEIVQKQTAIPALGHKLVNHPATKSSIEYWSCGTCGKTFTDSQGQKEITASALAAANQEVVKANTPKDTLTVTGKGVKKNKVTLKKGKSLQLKVKTNAKKVTYKTSKKKVATVSKKGKITAKKKGTAKITVTAGSKKVTIKVTVK